MSDKTAIEWTDATWNPITGCSVVSPGCTNCYAMRLAGTRLRNHATRKGLTRDTKAGPVWTGDVRFNEKALTDPLRWTKPRMIFVCAHGDLFHENVPDEWIDRIFAVMALCPQHTFQVLTKRSARMRKYFRPRSARRGDGITAALFSMGQRPKNPHWPLSNVWLGVSAEDQARADERIPDLLATPAAVRWVSAEPLIGPIDFRAWLPNAWKIKAPRRTWADFEWPNWVPDDVRAEIISFWNPAWGRGPNAWMRGAVENGQPPMGARGTFDTFRRGQPLVEGRFVPAWNNIGRVVADDGTTHCVSAGRYQSRPPRIDCIVVGGESGRHARPMHPQWPRDIRDQCDAAGVPFFFKQWGEWRHAPDRAHFKEAIREPWQRLGSDMEGVRPAFIVREGKRAAGRLLDGREHNAMPGRP